MDDGVESIDLDGLSPFSGEPLERPGAERLAGVLKALAEPSRLRILSILAASDEGLCVVDVVSNMYLSQPTVSHHLRILREAGLVSSKKVGVYKFYQVESWVFGVIAGLITPPRKRPTKRAKR
jgi:ArsR family transcriptional regulator